MPEKILSSALETKFLILMLLAWASRLAFSSGLTVGIVIRQLIISSLVGYVAAEYVLSQQYEEWLKIALFCGAVFLADDILVIVLAFGKHAKDNQETIFKKITKFLTGK